MDQQQDEIDKLNKAINQSGPPNLEEMIMPDPEVVIFFLEWSKNGLNAGAAYQTMHPSVTALSARVLGSRMLTKVHNSALLAMYNIDKCTILTVVKEGLHATKFNEFSGEQVPDHKTRLEYVKLAAKLVDMNI